MSRVKFQPTARRLLGVLFSAACLGSVGPLAWASGAPTALKAYTENLAPLNFSEDGRAKGISSELLTLMATEAGLALSIEVLPWQRAVQAASRHHGSILFSLTRTPERENRFQWVGPILPRRILLYRLTRRDELRPSGLGDLKGLRIGVVRDSAAAAHLLAAGLRADESLEFSLDDSHNLRKLMVGRMDLIAMLDWAASWHLRRLGLPSSALTPMLPLEVDKSYWYGLSLDTDPDIVRRLQEALDRLRRDGRLEQLRLRYLG